MCWRKHAVLLASGVSLPEPSWTWVTKSHQPPKLGSMMPIQALLNPECLIGSSVHRVLRAVAIVPVFLDLSSHGIFWQSLKKGLNFLCILVGLTISGLTGQMWQRLQGERQESETLPSWLAQPNADVQPFGTGAWPWKIKDNPYHPSSSRLFLAIMCLCLYLDLQRIKAICWTQLQAQTNKYLLPADRE